MFFYYLMAMLIPKILPSQFETNSMLSELNQIGGREVEPNQLGFFFYLEYLLKEWKSSYQSVDLQVQLRNYFRYEI